MTQTFITPDNASHIQVFDVLDETKPYTRIYGFVKNDLKLTRIGFQEIHQSIVNIMLELNVNFGLLMTVGGTFVLTEEKIHLNDVLVKLATGINYQKGIANVQKEVAEANRLVVRKENK